MSTEIPVYIKNLFDSYNRSYLLYHNFSHTQRVVFHTAEIADYYNIDSSVLFVLESAAWFHDTGQLTGDMTVHEETSVQFMKEYFSDKLVNESALNDIENCILATKMPVSPGNLLEEIICDADTYHLGTKDFQRLDHLVWQELELRLNKPIDNQAEKSLAFLEEHHFFTSYCQQNLLAGKNENITLLKAFIQNQSAK